MEKIANALKHGRSVWVMGRGGIIQRGSSEATAGGSSRSCALPFAALHGTGGKHFRRCDVMQPRRQLDTPHQEKLPAEFRKPDVFPLSGANYSPQNRTMTVLK